MMFRRFTAALVVGMLAILSTGCASSGYLFEPKNRPEQRVITTPQGPAVLQSSTVNVRQEEERVTQIVQTCMELAESAEPADNAANTQLGSRFLWGGAGSFALYGVACAFPATAWTCPMVIPMGLGYGALLLGTSVGDRIADKYRGEEWHVTQCVKEMDGGRNLIMPSKNVPEGKARLKR